MGGRSGDVEVSILQMAPSNDGSWAQTRTELGEQGKLCASGRGKRNVVDVDNDI